MRRGDLVQAVGNNNLHHGLRGVGIAGSGSMHWSRNGVLRPLAVALYQPLFHEIFGLHLVHASGLAEGGYDLECAVGDRSVHHHRKEGLGEVHAVDLDFAALQTRLFGVL